MCDCEQGTCPGNCPCGCTHTAPDRAVPGQWIITSLSIDRVVLTKGEGHPESTPIGPFESREAAWEHARLMQIKYGSGGGSVEVARLHAPRTTS